MELKKNILNKLFIGVFITWVISLVTVYLPISNLVPSTFPVTINDAILTIFVASTGIAFSLSLYLGLGKLRTKP